MILLSELSTIIGTLQELERMHQLNLELLEQLDVIFQWILENDVAIPNKDKFDILLSRMRSILKELYFSTPKSLIYRKLTDEKKHLNGTDDKVPVPAGSLYKGGIVFSEQLVTRIWRNESVFI